MLGLLGVVFCGDAVANPSRFVGMTMAQFMLEAMTTPSDYFETGGKRVFIAYKAAPDPRFGCNMQLITRYSGSGQGPDNWIIEQVRYSGGCEYF
jgi:hypothetical protein